jgi:hypothetical protein
MDIGLNPDTLDLELDDRNDLPLKRQKKRLFEQRLQLSVIDFFQRTLGENDSDFAIQMLELEAERVAQEYGEIESLSSFQAEYDSDTPNTINLSIVYDTGETFQFPVTE